MNRLLINLVAFFGGLLLALVIFMPRANAADLGLDAPVPENRPPVAAEFTFCDEPNAAGQTTIWYVVVSFANGDTLVFNAHHLHGAADESEAMEYIKSAKAQSKRLASCPPQL